MSYHKREFPRQAELTQALKDHGLEHRKPSQLADAFRLGWQAATRAQPQAGAAEPVAKRPVRTNSCRMENGRCGACGGDWSVCGCQGMFDRLAATQAPSAAKKEGQP